MDVPAKNQGVNTSADGFAYPTLSQPGNKPTRDAHKELLITLQILSCFV
jgi:hypothetical protein